MSFDATRWVWEYSGVQGAPLLVLLCLANSLRKGHEFTWPAVETIVTETGLSRRTVQRSLDVLVQRECLRIDARAGPYGTNRYYLLTASRPATVARPAPEGHVTGQIRPEGVPKSTKGGATVAHRPGRKPVIEPMPLDPDEVVRLGEDAARLKAELRNGEKEDPWDGGPKLSRDELRARREEIVHGARQAAKETK